MNIQLCILCNSFNCISPKLNIGIQLSKDGAQQLQDIELQIWMSFMTELQLLLSIIKHVNLCKTGSLARWEKKTTHGMMKSTLDSKSINSRCIHGIGDGLIKFCTKGGKRHYIII